MSSPEDRLRARLGYGFREPELLRRALSHRSAGSPNNERLEFLGDAVLNLVIAEVLYRASPQAHEGSLTRRRATLVKRETLAAVAREIGLGAALCLGAGELKSGGRDRDSILADALEAVIGAMYLDAGLPTCAVWLQGLMAGRLREACMAEVEKDPKTQLQEWLQGRGNSLPRYHVTAIEGEAHDQTFRVECEVPGLPDRVVGRGTSRRGAEQDAATRALERVHPPETP
jgi:ribonuclease-3